MPQLVCTDVWHVDDATTAVILRLVTNCGPSAVKMARLGTTYASDESSGPAHHARSDY